MLLVLLLLLLFLGGCLLFVVVVVVLVCLCCYVVKSARGREQTKSKRGGGGQIVEQLAGKIKGDSYASKCENYGVFFWGGGLLFVCVFLQKHYKYRGFSQFGALFSGGGGGCEKLGQ